MTFKILKNLKRTTDILLSLGKPSPQAKFYDVDWAPTLNLPSSKMTALLAIPESDDLKNIAYENITTTSKLQLKNAQINNYKSFIP